jgi:hypothetical protein
MLELPPALQAAIASAASSGATSFKDPFTKAPFVLICVIGLGRPINLEKPEDGACCLPGFLRGACRPSEPPLVFPLRAGRNAFGRAGLLSA